MCFDIYLFKDEILGHLVVDLVSSLSIQQWILKELTKSKILCFLS